MEFVDPSLPASQREVVIHCSRCQAPAIIKYRTWKARKRPYLCRSCAMQKARHKVSKGMKRHWQEVSSQDGFPPRRNSPSQETRNKISQSMKEHWQDPANRMSRSISAHQNREKWNANIGEGMRKKWQDPEYRRKVTEGNRKNADELWGFKVSLKKRLKQIPGND